MEKKMDRPGLDARAVASVIKVRPPVALLPEGGTVVDRFGSATRRTLTA